MKLINTIIVILMLSTGASAFDWTNVIDVPDKYIRDVMTADLTETECLALNIYHEARSESVLGRQLVAQVTMNRKHHEGFPDTVCNVVRQNKQFSWTHDGKVDHPANRKAYEEAYLIALSFTKLGQHAQVPYWNLLLNYHATYVSPNWSNLQAVIKHGEHIFYVRKRDIDRER